MIMTKSMLVIEDIKAIVNDYNKCDDVKIEEITKIIKKIGGNNK
jgi:hypothetical protein